MLKKSIKRAAPQSTEEEGDHVDRVPRSTGTEPRSCNAVLQLRVEALEHGVRVKREKLSHEIQASAQLSAEVAEHRGQLAHCRKAAKEQQVQLQKLHERMEEIEWSMLCSVCMERQADVVLLPCGHCFCCTAPCGSAELDACAWCHRKVGRRTKVFGMGSVSELASISSALAEAAAPSRAELLQSSEGTALERREGDRRQEEERGRLRGRIAELEGKLSAERAERERQVRALEEELTALKSEAAALGAAARRPGGKGGEGGARGGRDRGRGVPGLEANACLGREVRRGGGRQCQVCFQSETDRAGEVEYVDCATCGVRVHPSCYGEEGAAAELQARGWRCEACRAGEVGVTCVLCPLEGGALKPVEGGGWAHVVCATYVPEVVFVDPERLRPVGRVDQVARARWSLLCGVCKTRQGAAVQCEQGRCVAAWHALCGMEGGRYMNMAVNPRTREVDYVLRCPRHEPKTNHSLNLNLNLKGDGPHADPDDSDTLHCVCRRRSPASNPPPPRRLRRSCARRR